MYLSSHAQRLLDAGDIGALQALSYEKLLPEIVRQEILNSFLNPKQSVLSGDSVSEVLLDPTSYESLTEACVLSSGQIFSKTAIESHLHARRGKEVRCPTTQKVLENIGGTHLSYVLLPKIDEVIRGYKALIAKPTPEEALLKSYNPQRGASAAKETPRFHSAMAALHVDEKVPVKKITAVEPEAKKAVTVEPNAKQTTPLMRDVIGALEVKVAKNKVRIVIEINAHSSERANALESYLESALPQSRVDLSCSSYSMTPENFGRCWKKLRNNIFEIDLWFPPHHSIKRTFSDHHLLRLLAMFSTTLAIPGFRPDLSLFALENHQNCVGAVSEVLHAGGIRKFFINDQIIRTATSNIMSCLSLFAASYALEGHQFTVVSLFNSSVSLSASTVLPATIIARLISDYFNLKESDCFILGISISSICLELIQSSLDPWHLLELAASILLSTGAIKYFPKLFSESPISTVNSFALGNIAGRLIHGFISCYYLGRGGYISGIIWLLNQLAVAALLLTAIAGQLLPDALAFLTNSVLKMCKPYIPENLFSTLNTFCEHLKRFSWLVEKPNEFNELLRALEEIEKNKNEIKIDSTLSNIVAFFSSKFEQITTNTQISLGK